ncbi:hypothetical protein J5N97_001945 [Dioscorea zingiberensis]|uniref:DOG1 domain-containing protein n=1 Tax=Dioscorea zingiberensis TaxID=325984 RepID=A0A9D5BT46_9LILI|nr:hypothetical protein J5N97_001945 [Dioscorea zingiberensis]
MAHLIDEIERAERVQCVQEEKMKSAGLICRKKSSTRALKDLYAEWMETLRSTLLPLLRHSMYATSSALLSPFPAALPVSRHLGGAMVSSSDLLSTHVRTVHSHFQALLHALDLAARHDPSQLLSPSSSWRPSPLEPPFLWLGDIHPAVLPHLLRSFFVHPPEHLSIPFSAAFSSPSTDLSARLDQIARGLRLMVPAISSRLHNAQAAFLESIAAEWAAKGKGDSPKGETVFDGGAKVRVEELTSIILDANRLRRSVLAEIVGALDVHQAALFLEALAQCVIGFRDPELLREFEQCKQSVSPDQLVNSDFPPLIDALSDIDLSGIDAIDVHQGSSGLQLEGEYVLPLLHAVNCKLRVVELIDWSYWKILWNVSCPSCGCTLFDLQEISVQIREKTSHLPGVSIAIMGCIVNRHGEMADADFGLVKRRIAMEQATEALIQLIKGHGRWVDLPADE